MKTSKWLVLTMAAALVAGGVTVVATHAAPAAAGTGPLGQRRAALRERVKEKLGLTEDQVARIKAELAGEKDAITGLLKRLHTARADLRDTIQQTGAGETAVRAAAAKVADVEADIAVERAKLHGRISPILTADQVARMKEFQKRLDDFLDRAIETIGERLAAE
jgi:Spy/CpxP family protein refolding chaperone